MIIFLYYVGCFQTSDAEIEPKLLSVRTRDKEPTEHKTFSSLELSQQLKTLLHIQIERPGPTN